MGTTTTDRNGLEPPTTDRHASAVDDLLHRAAERDAAAAERDARAQHLLAALEADPQAHSALTVAGLAAADRSAAAADRAAAADDRAALLRLLRGERSCRSGAPPPDLTGRESQVLERLARAMSTRAIADDLYLSPNSVKTHTQSVYRKIGVRTRAEAALWARDHGIG